MRIPLGLRASAGTTGGGGGGGGGSLTQHSAVIDAVYLSGSGTGTYSGATGTTSQGSYRHGGFTGSCYFEFDVGPGNWAASTGFVGILDAAHWNAGPNYGGSTGERAMHYLGQSFAYGSNTGTIIANGSSETWVAGGVAGFVYNESNGKLQVYKNGVAGSIYTNTAFIGITKYPCVSYWTAELKSTMRTTPSAYASSYVLPT